MRDLFCDGGVIGHNPSKQGGTWAFCIVADDMRIEERSGVITPETALMPEVTNNLTEMLALIRALQAVPPTWSGTIYSDSQITLGRVFQGWKWKNIPNWMHAEFQRERKRLVNWDAVKWVLLQGHPTKAELAAGRGSRGYPVSIHNQWCDRACGERAQEFVKAFAELDEESEWVTIH